MVGARLLYQDDTIQHAGVVVGFGGIAGHTFIGLHKAENSYFHRAMSTQDYSAVTAACMMSKKSLFEEVGGFTEELAVAFNDIDYCMKVRAAGKLVVYNPYAHFVPLRVKIQRSGGHAGEDCPVQPGDQDFLRAVAEDSGRGRSLLQPEPDPQKV